MVGVAAVVNKGIFIGYTCAPMQTRMAHCPLYRVTRQESFKTIDTWSVAMAYVTVVLVAVAVVFVVDI